MQTSLKSALARTALPTGLLLISCAGPAPPNRAAEAGRSGAGGVELFVDVAAASGLDFVHFNGMSGERYLIEITGSGAALFDYDNDGDLDVYLVQGTMLGLNKSLKDALIPPQGPLPPTDRLYRNDLKIHAAGRLELRFTDVTAASGIAESGYGQGVAAGDVNNDGWVDLYITNYGPNQLLINNGDRSFRDATESSGTGDPLWGTSATFFDYDRDGWLDLYVANYVNLTYANHRPCETDYGSGDYCGPQAFQPLPHRLYRNRGDGTFEDASVRSGVAALPGNGLGVVAADFNGDRWIDLYVANDLMVNRLLINQRDGSFADQALWAGCALDGSGLAEASMGVDAADFDRDGDEDIFLTHLLNQTNTLYLNDGFGLFVDDTAARGLALASLPFTGFGTRAFDYDNDGWQDLLVVNGAVNVIEEQDQRGDLLPLRERNQLFRNVGGGRFEDLSQRAGRSFAVAEVSRGAAFGDVDNDGDPDVLVTNNAGPARLLRNQQRFSNRWIGLRLQDRHGRDALGAVVEVRVKGQPPLRRRVHTDGSYCSASDPRILVGLAQAAEVEAIQVWWPTGEQERWPGLRLGRYHTLTQGSGQPASAR